MYDPIGLVKRIFSTITRKQDEDIVEGGIVPPPPNAGYQGRPSGYMVSLKMICRNCGQSRMNAILFVDSIRPGSHDFILDPCEHCGVQRFNGTFFAKLYESGDQLNVERKAAIREEEKALDARDDKLLQEESSIVRVKSVEGKRLD